MSGGVLGWLCVWGEVQICMSQLMSMPLTVSCCSKSRLVLVPDHPDDPGQSPEGHKMDVCMYVCMKIQMLIVTLLTLLNVNMPDQSETFITLWAGPDF